MALTGLCALATLTVAPEVEAQTISAGAAYLARSQDVDGSWPSTRVRSVQATAEALRALQAVAQQPSSRAAAADFLGSEPIADSDDLARRLGVLAIEGRAVASLEARLVADADPRGGWGLTAAFAASPLDTALTVQALAGGLAPENEALRGGLRFLLSIQRGDGGFRCAETDDGESEIFCTSHALLALAPFRSEFFLEPEIGAAVGFLRSHLNPDGSFGPAGLDRIILSALASSALAAVSAFGSEVTTVAAFLEAGQQRDGSWQSDPYPTSLALRALALLSTVPYCGDGQVNQPGEACDGSDLMGLTCEAVGLGAGTLACGPQCTLDVSGCTEAAICGDHLRNQLFEVCDGTDLAAESCESLGFTSGSLDCAADCKSFDVSGCSVEASCGDGVVNLPGELCDLSDLRGQTCESLGLGSGPLQCGTDCNLDTSLCGAAGFTIDNKGREFFVGFMRNLTTLGTTAALHLTSDVPTTVTVHHPINNPSFVRTVGVRPGRVTIVELPTAAHSSWSAGHVRNNAVRISGPEEFVAFLVNRRAGTSDAGMALPVDALGTSYIVTTFRGSAIVPSDRSHFLVIAPFDGTRVTITPTTSMRLPGSSAPPGVPVQIALNRGEGFYGEATFAFTDLTGTVITANRPVAVINGNACTTIPSSVTACDHIFEVAHPLRSWGKSALLTNLPNRPGGSFYRVVASVDDTEVFLDGDLQVTLDRGDFLETGPLPGNHVIMADHPIFVTQFMTGISSPGAVFTGDPAMANLIPPEQYLESYTFSTVGGAQFDQHFLTVTAPDSALDTIQLDGIAIDPGAFAPVPGSGFSSAVLPLAEGSHTVSSSQPHGVTVEGFKYVDSYIYPGGARLELINPFCGDGEVNRSDEECDGSDFEGVSCTTLGFSAGYLQCTVDCRTDTSQCSGISAEDRDDDGFPAYEDCDDRDPEVNPGMVEIPGNQADDDCSVATPDEIPEESLSCRLVSNQLRYSAAEPVGFQGVIQSTHELYSLVGLGAFLVVRESAGVSVFEEMRQLGPLPPGARARLSFAFGVTGHPPGEYLAELSVTVAGGQLAQCSAAFTVDSSATTGAGLTGALTLDPELVNAGASSQANYTVENDGNAALTDLALRVALADPDSGGVVGELLDVVALEPGASYDATQPLTTVGLEANKSYLAVLLALPKGAEEELTLDSAALTVVNGPPDCSSAMADPGRLWPPNHNYVDIDIAGVTDPDGDPVQLTVTGILQDERTDDLGSGDTCPDAAGVDTSGASVRAERSGRQDGRVVHLFFVAEDDRGGTCEGEVTICVPHDRKARCVDQGRLYDSTTCP